MKIFYFLISVFFLSCFNENIPPQKKVNDDLISVISSLIEKDITNDSLYVERAILSIEKERYKEAVKDLEQSINLDPTKGHSHYLLGDVFFRMAKNGLSKENVLDKSLFHFSEAVKYHSDSVLSLKNAGEILLLNGTVLEDTSYIRNSIQLLHQSISIDNSNFHSFILLGYCYKEINEIEKAKDCFRKSISLKSDNEDAYLQLGNLYAAVFDTTAIEYYNNALSINPKNRIAHYNIGILYQNNKMYSKAQDAYHKLFNDGMEDKFYVDANHNLGFIFMEDLKDYRNAINYFADATRVNRNHYQSYFGMGRCYQSFGDVTNAEKYYRKALEVFPNYTTAQQQLDQLLLDNEKYK